MASKTVRIMRQSKYVINSNMDLFFFIMSLLGALILGFLLCLLAVSFAQYLNTPIEGGLKTVIASLVAVVSEVIFIYKKLCTPPGEIVQKIQAGDTKKYDPETFNTIVDGG